MTLRSYEFVVGPETGTLPTTGVPGSGSDLVTVDYIRKIVGTRASPQNITTSGIAISDTAINEIIYIQGSGGAVDITANPQITAPTDSLLLEGMWLTLIGRSNTNTVLIGDGDGVSINGTYLMGEGDTLELWWDGTVWHELARRAGG